MLESMVAIFFIGAFMGIFGSVNTQETINFGKCKRGDQAACSQLKFGQPKPAPVVIEESKE